MKKRISDMRVSSLRTRSHSSDLDIVTVAEWDSNKAAISFIARIKKGEFYLITPYLLLELLSKWEYKNLALKIEHFYNLYSKKIITAQETLDKIKNIGLDRDKLVGDLIKKKVKEEDAALVLIASIFEIDFLVTLNRKHLRNKEKEINEVLKNNGLKPINIRMPNGI